MTANTGGHWICDRCGAYTLTTKDRCFQCHSPRPADPPKPTPAAVKPKRRSPPPMNPLATAGRTSFGSLVDCRDETLRLVVHGEPRSQGSTVAVATGVTAASDKQNRRWRAAITAEALRVCGPRWVAANGPVHLSIVWTVPQPASAPTTFAVPADGWRDIDKLFRSVHDALSEPKSLDRRRLAFRVIASDMRTCSSTLYKTHPRPLHTHPLALDRPGVCIDLRPLRVEPFDDVPVPQSSPVFQKEAA